MLCVEASVWWRAAVIFGVSHVLEPRGYATTDLERRRALSDALQIQKQIAMSVCISPVRHHGISASMYGVSEFFHL
jgi:hypothetical protein